MEYNATLERDKLTLGQEFIKMYDIAMSFEKERIGFNGYIQVVEEKKEEEGKKKNQNGKMIGVVIGITAAIMILIILAFVVKRLKN